MYQIQDIEVFILTHKRPEFLQQTIDCYLNQSVQGFRLAVFSNGHSPQTKQILQDYTRYGVEDFYIDEEITGEENLARAIAQAKGKLLVVAHDDDLIHREYIASLLALFNKWPRLTLAVSSTGEFSPTVLQKPAARTAWHFKTANEFAAFIYSGQGFTFSSSCYVTANIKQTDPFLSKSFGKVGDVPFMTFACERGQAAVTQFPFVQYRIHKGQDSFNYATGPTAKQWLQLSLFYKQQLNTPRLKRIFRLQNYRHIRYGWKDWTKCEHGRMTWKEFEKEALRQKALTRPNIWLGALLRGKLNRWLQRKILGINPQNY